jgi:two-component system sensor histidine kinase MprB
VTRFGFRSRVVLLTALALAATVAATAVAVWFVAKHELYDQVDSSLAIQAQQSGPFGSRLNVVIDPSGEITGPLAPVIPISSRIRALLAGRGPSFFYEDTLVSSFPVRELVVRRADGGAVIAVQQLAPTRHALARIRFWLLLVGGLGIVAAMGLAAGVATLALRPVRRLTSAAESVAATGDLGQRVDVEGPDEIGRLATQFNAMLAALEHSVGAQRRLVADASHELRTPLTAVRTNLELLREGALPELERERALAESASELEALSVLVADLVELARGQERQLRVEEVHLDELVSSCVERAQSRSPQVVFSTSLSPTVVQADATLVERAVSNLLDNAVKYSPAGAVVEVEVRDGAVAVRDHGPGIAPDDLPHIFDRFYRAATARSKPGAGLGLAIVREAAEAHGGRATVESDASGARFRLALPRTV